MGLQVTLWQSSQCHIRALNSQVWKTGRTGRQRAMKLETTGHNTQRNMEWKEHDPLAALKTMMAMKTQDQSDKGG